MKKFEGNTKNTRLSIDDRRSERVERYQRDGVVVRASASQSVDLAFISLVESYLKTFNSFAPAIID